MYELLKQIMEQKFQVPGAEIGPDATLADLGLDSLDLVELSLVLEKEAGVQITDDELAEAGSLESVVGLVSSRRAAA